MVTFGWHHNIQSGQYQCQYQSISILDWFMTTKESKENCPHRGQWIIPCNWDIISGKTSLLSVISQVYEHCKVNTVFRALITKQIVMLGVLFCCDTHGSLFSWEPNMIIDLRAFQSCRTLSRASWAKRGGSRSWSGISESKREEKREMYSYTTCLPRAVSTETG